MTLQKPIWLAYKEIHTGQHHTISGNIQIAQEVWSPQLRNHRDIVIYLPPGYADGNHRYPVLYMHDGQNLFDAVTSFSGEWHIDEIMETLSRDDGLEAIIVAIPNMGADRLNEYSPFRDAKHGGGKGNKYVHFLTNTLKPIIDRDFRTRPEREFTGIMGSSMGGLISLYAFFHNPDTFGYVGAMSTSLWFAQGAILDYIKSVPYRGGRIYMDVGTREYGRATPADPSPRKRSRRLYASTRRMQRILIKKGYRPTRTLIYVEEKWAGHHEPAWTRRIPQAFRFFFSSFTE